MISKIWKKLAFIILIIACLFNIIYKLVHKLPAMQELSKIVAYTENEQKQENNVQNNTKSVNVIRSTKSNTKNNSNVTANSVIDLLK